jgi:hypothetical protein
MIAADAPGSHLAVDDAAGMPANPDEIAPSVFYLLSDAPDSEDTAFVRLMGVLN